MNQYRTCPKCGTQISEDSTERLCPACLLKTGFEPTASEVDEQTSPELAETFVPDDANVDQSEAFQQSSETTPRPGSQFGDYQIIRRLGQGGMGTVFEADQLSSGRRVALKVLSHALESREARSRFLREGRLAAAINHPNSVYVFGTEEINGVPTISMELIAGGTLESRIRDQGPMPVADAVDAILQVIDGLQAAERRGVLHRDVKPANCFVDETGVVKVGDFGLSVSTEPRDLSEITNVSREGVFLGTPAFASPEQLRGEQLDRRSDIYSVGVTLYYLLTGKAPFSGDNMVQLLATVLDKPAPPVQKHRSDVPTELASIIEQCLAKSPAARPGNYDELRKQLTRFSSQVPVPASLSQRCVAGGIDYLVYMVFSFVVTFFGVVYFGSWSEMTTQNWWLGYVMTTMNVCYFGICESRWGMTIGKWLLRIRVHSGQQLPSPGQSFVRSAIYTLVPIIPNLIVAVVYRDIIGDPDQLQRPENRELLLSMMGINFSWIIILALLFVTARRRNGYAAIHDLFSRTRVYNVLQPAVRKTNSYGQDDFQPGETQRKVGGYSILETLDSSDPDHELLLGYDSRLLRRVWIRLVPANSPPVDSKQREYSRTSRLRWLAGQRGEENWDCYEAPEGCALLDLPADSEWDTDRQLLNKLSQELKRGLTEKSLPKSVGLKNVWICGGEIKLLPFAAPNSGRSEIEHDAHPVNSPDAEQNCVALLDQAGQWLTRGRTAQDNETVYTMPLRAREAIDKLASCSNLNDCYAILRPLCEGSVAVSRRRRLALVTATYALVAFMLLGTAVNMMTVRMAEDTYPEIGKLASDCHLLELARNMDSNVVPEGTVEAIEITIAGRHRDIIEDPVRMNSMRANIQLMPHHRRMVRDIIQSRDPDQKEMTEAKPLYDQAVEQYGPFAVNTFFLPSPAMSVTITAIYWLMLVWVPGLIAAVMFGGGLIVKAFDIGIANRHGQRASRVRVLLRTFLIGLPWIGCVAALIASFGTAEPALFLSHEPSLELTILLISVSLVLFTVSVTGKRFLSDRLSGCYLVRR